MQSVRVLLADDHTVVREGLVRLLEANFEVVSTVGDGRSAVAQAEALRPDVVLLDIGLPLLNGIEAATQIRSVAPECKVVVLTQHGGKEYVQAAFRSGVCGYILKNAAASEMVNGITEVLAGRAYLSEELRVRFGDMELPRPGQDGASLAPVLTPRQREVLQLVAEGKSAKEIAHILSISVKTVEFHKASIMDQLGIRTTAELTRYAMEQRIVPVAQ